MSRLFVISIVPVGPRAARVREQWFALLVSAANAAADAPFPLPWQSPGFGDTICVFGQTQNNALWQASLTPDAVERPGKVTDPAGIEAWLLGANGERSNDYDWQWHEPPFSAQSSAQKANLSQSLAYLSTAVGGVPQTLKLLFYFQLSQAPDDLNRFVAAPSIAGVQPTAPQAALDQHPFNLSYGAGQDAARVLATFIQPVVLPGRTVLSIDDELNGLGEPFINVEDYWIRAKQVDPWVDEVKSRSLQVTDVLARLVDFRRWALLEAPPVAPDVLAAIDSQLTVAPSYYNYWTSKERDSLLASVQLPLAANAAEMTEIRARVVQLQADLDADTTGKTWTALLAAWLTDSGNDLSTASSSDESTRTAAIPNALSARPARWVDSGVLFAWSWALTRDSAHRLDSDLLARWRRECQGSFRKLFGIERSFETSFGPARRRESHASGLARSILADHGATGRAGAVSHAKQWLSALPIQFGNLLSQTIVPFPQVEWARYVDCYVDGCFDVAATPFPATKRSLGLSLQVGTPAHTSDEALARSWEKAAGVGLLLKDHGELDPKTQQAAPKWRLANAAELLSTARTPLLADPTLVPIRVPFRDGVRHPFLTYDQTSPVAESPLTRATAQLATTTTTRKSGNLSAQFRFGAVLDLAKDWARLTRLKYGRDYEAAVFLIDAGFGLPSALTSDKPWRLDPDKVATAQPTTSELFQYRRTVPVGQVRLSPLDPVAPTDWPLIPATVLPLAREVTVFNDDGSHGPVLVGGIKRKTWTLGLKPPTVDLDVIERWPSLPFSMKEAIASYLDSLWKAQHDPSHDDAHAFDDPAVAGYALAVDSYAFDNQKTDTSWKFLPTESKAPRRGWQKLEISVVASLGTDAAIEINQDQPSIIRLVSDGLATVVARVRVFVLVSKKWVEGASTGPGAVPVFPPGFFDPLKTEQVLQSPDFSDFIAFDPVSVLFEVPGTAFPSELELWLALTVAPKPDTREAVLSLQSGGDPTKAAQLRNIARAEIMRQPWRWQGRPLEDYPLKDNETPAASNSKQHPCPLNEDQVDTARVLAWEVAAFAELDDDLDSSLIPVGHAIETAGTVPLLVDRINDARSSYIRYAVRAFYRYAGLTGWFDKPMPNSRVSRQENLQGFGYKRAFFGYAGKKPNKPALSAILPLTQGFSPLSRSAMPCFLFHDTAFASVGITESVEFELLTSMSPDTKKEVLEYGRDPIISAEQSDKVPLMFRTLEAKGAFGFTLDSEAVRDPLFNSSSYIVTPPTSVMPWDVMPWDFFKVHFRRVERLGELSSDWSDPVWVQATPTSTFGGNLSIQRQGADWAFVAPNGAGDLDFLAQAGQQFQYLILLTRSIVDYRGDLEHETYYKTLKARPGSAHSNAILFTVDVPPKEVLFARLVEIQVAPGKDVPDGDTFWSALIAYRAEPGSDNQIDASYRVTRVSPRARLASGAAGTASDTVAAAAS